MKLERIIRLNELTTFFQVWNATNQTISQLTIAKMPTPKWTMNILPDIRSTTFQWQSSGSVKPIIIFAGQFLAQFATPASPFHLILHHGNIPSRNSSKLSPLSILWLSAELEALFPAKHNKGRAPYKESNTRKQNDWHSTTMRFDTIIQK